MATDIKTAESWITLGMYGKYRDIEKITVQNPKDWGRSYKGPYKIRLIIHEGNLNRSRSEKMTWLDMSMSRADAKSLAKALLEEANK